MKGRALLVAATAWLAVVAVGSMMVWAVISRAGERVVPSAETAGVGAGPGRAPAGIDTPASSHEPSRRSSGAASPNGSASGPGATTAPGDSQAPSSSPSRPVQPPSSPRPPTQTPRPPQPALRSGSWSGAAGLVYAECRGTRIVTVTAQADSGWSVQVEERGPGELKVKFTANAADSHQVEVSGRCVSGSPRFGSEESGGGVTDDSADD